MRETRPVNCPDEYWDVFCGRGSKWLAPSAGELKAHLDAKKAAGVIRDADIQNLQGKRLGCFYDLGEREAVEALARLADRKTGYDPEVEDLI